MIFVPLNTATQAIPDGGTSALLSAEGRYVGTGPNELTRPGFRRKYQLSVDSDAVNLELDPTVDVCDLYLLKNFGALLVRSSVYDALGSYLKKSCLPPLRVSVSHPKLAGADTDSDYVYSKMIASDLILTDSFDWDLSSFALLEDSFYYCQSPKDSPAFEECDVKFRSIDDYIDNEKKVAGIKAYFPTHISIRGFDGGHLLETTSQDYAISKEFAERISLLKLTGLSFGGRSFEVHST